MTPFIKKKRYALLVLVSACIVLFAFSPFILSSSSALNFFISAVNRNISGTLSIDSWLIGWQQGILCQNVAYTNPEKGITVSVPHLTSNRGLIELVLAPKNLGIVHVDSPVVELSGRSVHAFFAQGKTAATATVPGRPIAGEKVPVWDQLLVDLKSRDGQVRIAWEDQDITVDLKGVSVNSTLSAGIAAFEIGFQAMEQGFVDASGTLNLPAHEHGWLETIIAEAEIKVSSLQLRELLRAGAAVSEMPQGEGVVNADFRLKVVGLESFEYSGLAELTGLRLSGGFLEQDHPAFQKVHLAAEEGKWTPHGWSVKGFELDSDTLNMIASVAILPDTKQLSAQGGINLPVLFDQVPRFLNVNESTFLESGMVDFTVDVTGSTNPAVKIKAKASRIGGIFEDQSFSWDSPLSIFINGEKKGSEFQISALQLDAPFARAKGSGDLHSFVMDAVLDLNKAFTDIGTLFHTGLTGSGKMEMMMKSGPAGRELFKVDTDFNISDFMLNRGDQPIIPLHQLSMIGSFAAPDTFVEEGKGELDIQIALSSWLGEIFLVLNGEKHEGMPFKGYYTTDSELDLAQMTTLFRAMNILDRETRLAGIMQMQAAGFAGDGLAEIRDMSAEITNFTLEGNGATFNEPGMKMKIMQPMNEEVPFLSIRELKLARDKETFFRTGAGLNLIKFPARNVILHNVKLEAESVASTLNRLVIPDWRKPYDGIRAQFSMSADLERMTEALQAVGLLPGETFFSGSSQATFLLEERDSSSQELRMDVQVADFGVKRRDKIFVDSEEVVFSTLLQGQVPSGEMTVEEVKLRSGILDLDVSGKVSGADAMQMLELNGSMKPALDRVAAIISKEFDLDLKMKGQPEEQIVIRYPLRSRSGESAGKPGIFSSVHAESLVFSTIDLRDVVVPFHFDNSKLHMELSGRMNEGRVELVTDTDFMTDPAVVRTPGNSQIMTGVKLNDSLVSTLLSRIHPLFGGLTESSGIIDVRLDSLWWPVGEAGKNEANFVAIFDAREIRLESRVVLKNILSVFGLENEPLRLRDNEIYCIGNNGRIKCSPIRIMAGDFEIIVGGSVYMDKSLDYEVEVPVTKKLVSDEGYQLLEGITLKVPVTGTIDAPSFDRETVISAIQNLMKKTAGELLDQSTGETRPL